MRLLRASAVFAAALAPTLIFSAHAQDQKKTEQQNQIFIGVKQDAKEEFVEEVRFKPDLALQVSEDPDIRRKVTRVAIFLEPNTPVIVTTIEGKIIDLAKGQLKSPLAQLAADLQKAIQEASEDDEVLIKLTGNERPIIGRIRKKSDPEGKFKILPATKPPKEPAAGKLTYDKNGSELQILYKEIKTFTNLTLQLKQEQQAQQQPNLLTNDTVSRQDLRVGDTVKVRFNYGQIAQVNSTAIVVNEWKGDSFGDAVVYQRDKLGEVFIVPLPRNRKYPVNGGAGEVVLKEEKQREGRKNQLTLRGTVWHDQKEHILVGATLLFQAGPAGTNYEQLAPTLEEVPIPPIFGGGDDPWKKEKICSEEDGQVVLRIEAKNMIPAASPQALPHIVTALATMADSPALGRVYNAAALNGDPELALMLVTRHKAVPDGPDAEKQQGVILEALQKFGEKGSKALVDHLRVPDGTYAIPVPHDDGTIGHKEVKDQALFWKRYEIKMLASMPGGCAGERGRYLFDLYEEHSTELGEAIIKVFQTRTSEAIDSLLDIAVSSGGKFADEAKRSDDATQVLKQLGDPGFNELVARVKANGSQGPVLARQLQVRKDNGTAGVPELIQEAIGQLVAVRLAQRQMALARVLEDAKAKKDQKDWEGALKIAQDVLSQDRNMEDAKKLLYECLVKVAELRLTQKKRGDAAALLHKVIDDGQAGKGAEPMLAKILIEAAREDLDANCIRKEPDEASEVVKKVNKADVLKVAAVKIAAEAQWYPIKLDEKGNYGWINRDAVETAGDGSQCTVHDASMKPENIRATLALVRKYSAASGPDADAIDGELFIRDAKAKYEAGQYAAAYASYQKARELIPNDPQLGESWKAWVFANGMLLLIFGAVLLIAGVMSVLVLRNRQKRVKVAEFKYYGKDRVRVEREIDGVSNPTGEAVPPEEGGAPAPADQPSDAAPPA